MSGPMLDATVIMVRPMGPLPQALSLSKETGHNTPTAGGLSVHSGSIVPCPVAGSLSFGEDQVGPSFK